MTIITTTIAAVITATAAAEAAISHVRRMVERGESIPAVWPFALAAADACVLAERAVLAYPLCSPEARGEAAERTAWAAWFLSSIADDAAEYEAARQATGDARRALNAGTEAVDLADRAVTLARRAHSNPRLRCRSTAGLIGAACACRADAGRAVIANVEPVGARVLGTIEAPTLVGRIVRDPQRGERGAAKKVARLRAVVAALEAMAEAGGEGSLAEAQLVEATRELRRAKAALEASKARRPARGLLATIGDLLRAAR